MLLSITTMAGEIATKPDCKDVIGACDRALAAKNNALSLSDLAIKDCKKQNGELHQKNESLLESASSWYHNPFIVGILGIAVGAIVSQTVIFKR
jgi:hypothetical protein